jgi:hypothetical protein
MKISDASVTCLAALAGSMFLVLVAGCGGVDTYSGQNSSRIEYDCVQTAPCDPRFSAHPDPINECVADTSAKLDHMSDEFRALYEARFTRCERYTGCNYFACAQDDNLFSIMHATLIQNECQQTIDCNAMTNGVVAAAGDLDVCIGDLAQALDFAVVSDRASWAQRSMRCTGQIGCAYVACQ